MEDVHGLYHQEEKVLAEVKKLAKDRSLTLQDLDLFISKYEQLLEESKVITKVSDRLQKKLDRANDRIKSQNAEIIHKNSQLENTIDQLVKMRVGKKASTIMFTAAVILFVSEEYFLEPLLSAVVDSPLVDLGIKGLIAYSLKLFESSLEKYFYKQEQNKLLKQEAVGDAVLSPQQMWRKYQGKLAN